MTTLNKPATPLPGIAPNACTCEKTHSLTPDKSTEARNSPNVHELENKSTVALLHDGILSSRKKDKL